MKLRLFIASVLIFLGIITAAPYAVKLIAQNQLKYLGANPVKLEDIDLNLFTGLLRIKNLDFSSESGKTFHLQELSIDIDWLPLIKKRIFIQNVIVDNLDLDIELIPNQSPQISGLGLPHNEDKKIDSAPSTWMFALQNARIKNTELRIKMPQGKHTVQIKNAQLGSMIQWFPGDAATLALEARINDSPLILNTSLSPFNKHPTYHIDVDIENFDISVAQAFVSDIKQIQGKVSTHSQLQIQQRDKQVSLTHTGEITLNDFSLELQNKDTHIAASTNQLNLSGSSEATFDKNTTFKTQSKLKFKALSYADKNSAMALQLNTASITGKVKYSGQNKGTYQAQLDMDFSALSAIQAHSKQALLKINNAAISQFMVDETPTLLIQKASFNGIKIAPEDKKYLSQLEQLDITTLQQANQHLTIENITLNGGQTFIEKNTQGIWNFDTFLKSLTPAEKTDDTDDANENSVAVIEEPKNTAQEPFTFNIKKLAVKNDYLIQYDDTQTTPPFSLKTTVAELTINQIDNLNIEKPAIINLNATLENHGKVNMFSKIYPFKPKLSAAIKTKISGLDLPVFSSYVAPALGVQIKSGLLTSKIDIDIKQDIIDGLADITLEQLIMGELSEEQKKKLDEGADLSLNTSLEMLRDKNNRIHLKIPVTGDIHSPDFNPNDVIKQATAKAAKAGALKYLTQTLQPYGSLITIAKFAGEQLTKVRLNPIEFKTGSDELSTESQAYLKKVAMILKERPKIAIRICGFSSQNEFIPPPVLETDIPSETPPKQEQNETTDPKTYLLNLAKIRAEKVKNHLIDTLQAPNERLVGCLPEIDTKKENAGRVDLYI